MGGSGTCLQSPVLRRQGQVALCLLPAWFTEWVSPGQLELHRKTRSKKQINKTTTNLNIMEWYQQRGVQNLRPLTKMTWFQLRYFSKTIFHIWNILINIWKGVWTNIVGTGPTIKKCLVRFNHDYTAPHFTFCGPKQWQFSDRGLETSYLLWRPHTQTGT